MTIALLWQLASTYFDFKKGAISKRKIKKGTDLFTAAVCEKYVMQIMLIINKVLSVVFICFMSASYAMATENHSSLLDVNNTFISIYAKNGLVRVTYSGRNIFVDRESKAVLAKMDSISIISNKAFLVNDGQYFWSFIRLPSRNSNGVGYCGAGFEDFIILFSINKNKLSYIDKYQAQSCLENFFIGIDSIKDVNSKVLFSPETYDIDISQDQFKEEKVTTQKIRLKAMPPKIETTILESN